MQFTGHGVVFNPAKNKALVSFNRVDIYETNDEQEIEVLKSCPNCQCISEELHEQPTPRRRRRTKAEIEADKKEIEAEDIIVEEPEEDLVIKDEIKEEEPEDIQREGDKK